MKVREIMTSPVKSISPDTSAKEALELLGRLEISGLPVIGSNNKLLGMFTEKNILAYILPSYIEKVGKFVYEDNPKMVKKKLGELSGIKVSQLMRREVITTTEDTTLCEVAKIMLTQKVRRVPVLDECAKVVGMVARCDILKAFAKEAEEAK